MNLKKLFSSILTLVLPLGFIYGQAQINMNGAYIVNNNVQVVVDNSNTNALISTNNGWMIPKSEFSLLTWNIGTSTGNYIVPFGDTTLNYLPVTLNINAAGTGNGSVQFSTYHTPALNSSAQPSDVTNLTPFILPGSPSNSDNSYNIVDRFYIVDANTGYSTKPTIGNLTLPYVSGTSRTEIGGANTLTESRLMAQRFNSSSSTWSDWFGYGCTDAVVGNVGSVQTGPVASGDFYRSWSVWDNTMSLPVQVAGVNGSTCGGAGSATATIHGGKSPYTYSWSNGATSSSASGLSGGTYTVNVHDNNGCSSTASVTITQSAALVASWYRISNVTCFGAANGTATPQIAGGSSPYTYVWASTPTSTINTTTNHSALNLQPGYTYTLTITDANGCSATLGVTVTQPATAVAETITLNSQPTCHGYFNAKATATPSGGTPGYKYIWSDAETTQQATALDATTVSCEVIDANGCTILKTLVIGQPANITGTFSNKVTPLCNGGNGSMTVAGAGGTPGYTYSWAPVGGTGTVATNIPAQTYTVTINDSHGCTGSATAALAQPAALANTITRTACVNGKSTLSAHPTGGTSPYTYAWSTSSTQGAIIVPPGTYSVSINDNHSCNVATTYSFAACPVIKPRDGENGDTITPVMQNITVYPNPTTGQFTIAGIEKGMMVELYDYTGRKISSQATIDNYQVTLNLSSQPNGIYLIRILNKDGNLVEQRKLVKTQ